MSEKDGGPAFPEQIAVTPTGDTYSGAQGISTRAYLAAKALQGFCANPAVFAANDRSGWTLVNCTNEQLAFVCLSLADSMLEALAE